MNNDILEVERDFETYKLLLDKWAAENPIKTNKLQVLLAANAILVSATGVGGGLTADKWYLYLAGVIFCLVWTFSIGRTALFQSIWKEKIEEMRVKYPDDPRFSILDTARYKRAARRQLRVLGGISSKWYLMYAPFVFALAWLAVLVYTLVYAEG